MATTPPPQTRTLALFDLGPILREDVPDLVVSVVRADTDSDTYLWDVYPSSAGIGVPDTTRSRTLGPDAQREQVAQRWRDAVAADRNPQWQFDQLLGLGVAIGDAIPNAVRDALQALIEMSAEPPTVLLLSEEPYTPWELAVLDAKRERPFLGAQVAISRWPLVEESRYEWRTAIDVTSTAVVSARYENVPFWPRLEHAEQEAADLFASYQPAVEVAPVYADVRAFVSGERHADLLHFAMHGQFQPDTFDGGLVLIGDRGDGKPAAEFLTANTVRAGSVGGAFVFLNACQVGAGDRLLGNYTGLAVEFLRAGASAVIAPLGNVNDERAGDLAREFYKMAYTDEPRPSAAEIVRRFRDRYRRVDAAPGSATNITYQLWGHPRLVLSRRTGEHEHG